MEEEISNLDTEMTKKTNELKNLSSKPFESRKITFSISHILSLFILLISITLSWNQYKQQTICEVLITNENEENIQWISSSPNYSNSESYLSLDNGAFVYRHIFMDEFEKEFNVKPIQFPIIDPDIANLLAKHNLRSKLLNYTEHQEFALSILKSSDDWSPIIENIKNEVENGTYVDDRRIYVRWVNDIVRWGMFANRNFQANELLGIFAGFITRTPYDVEYAWEYNYIMDVVDDNGKKVNVCIDGKHMGNYMRFANHRDSNQNGDIIYVVHDIWYILYITKTEVKAHEQIFVNYGEEYWESKKKYEFK